VQATDHVNYLAIKGMYHKSLERLFQCYNHDLSPRGCPAVWDG